MEQAFVRTPIGPNLRSIQSHGLVGWYPLINNCPLEHMRGGRFSHSLALTINPYAGLLPYFDNLQTTYLELNHTYEDVAFQTERSISAWCYPYSIGGSGVVDRVITLFRGDWSTSIGFGSRNGFWSAFYRVGDTFLQADSSYTAQPNQLVHLALVTYGTNVLLYVNGQRYLLATNGGVPNAGTPPITNAVLGGVYFSNEAWHGHIWDVRIYNRALAEEEVWQMYDPLTRFDLYDTYDPLSRGILQSVTADLSVSIDPSDDNLYLSDVEVV